MVGVGWGVGSGLVLTVGSAAGSAFDIVGVGGFSQLCGRGEDDELGFVMVKTAPVLGWGVRVVGYAYGGNGGREGLAFGFGPVGWCRGPVWW